MWIHSVRLWKTVEDIAQVPTPVEHDMIDTTIRGVGFTTRRASLCFVLQKGFQTFTETKYTRPPIGRPHLKDNTNNFNNNNRMFFFAKKLSPRA